ncbi:MAG: helix-turn-helix transcriptional regulator [Bacteroidia bacterium]
MKTGEVIKAYRERMNLSQEAVATFLDIKRETLSYYENNTDGRAEAPLEVLEKLADLYGTDLADFFENDASQLKANLAFAFRATNLKENDLSEIAQFRKVIKNYLKIINLENNHAS